MNERALFTALAVILISVAFASFAIAGFLIAPELGWIAIGAESLYLSYAIGSALKENKTK